MLLVWIPNSPTWNNETQTGTSQGGVKRQIYSPANTHIKSQKKKIKKKTKRDEINLVKVTERGRFVASILSPKYLIMVISLQEKLKHAVRHNHTSFIYSSICVPLRFRHVYYPRVHLLRDTWRHPSVAAPSLSRLPSTHHTGQHSLLNLSNLTFNVGTEAENLEEPCRHFYTTRTLPDTMRQTKHFGK